MAAARISCGYIDDVTGLPCVRVAIQLVYDLKNSDHDPAMVPSCGTGGLVHDHGSNVVWVW